MEQRLSVWPIKLLGEVCETTSGGTPNRKNSAFYNGTIPWVKSGELDKGVIFDTEEKITSEAIKSSSAKLFPKGTLLIALYGATIGKLAFLGVEAATNQAICGIFQNENINSKFLYQFLSYQKPSLVKQGIGGAQPNISQGILRNLEIPLPPLAEQERIVSKIEELFSELEKGKEQILLAQQQLKTYRQAVLASLIDADNLVTIDSIITKMDQGWSPKCENEASTDHAEWCVIKTTAIQAGYFLQNENKRLPKNLVPRKQHELKAGDLLITRAGPRVRVGVCCLVRATRPNLLNCDKVYRMRLESKLARPEYIEKVLNSPIYAKKIEEMKTGISDSGVNLTQKGFLQILIPLPSLEVQHRIVLEIESRLSVCDALEATLQTSLEQAEVLRQSILKRAFEGRLV